MVINRRGFLRRSAALAASAYAVSPAAAQGGTIEGIDVSFYQGVIDWTSVYNSGVRFAICKATEGLTITDSKFATNWAAMKNVGLVRGAYHYGHPQSDPVRQARRLYDTVRPASGDLPVVLDFEDNDGITNDAAVGAWAQRFCQEIRRKMGRPPIIYTGFYFWRDDAGNLSTNFGCPLWMARWGTSSPNPLPTAWNNWAFWQYSATGSVPGISGNVDLDRFNGSLATLQNYVLP